MIYFAAILATFWLEYIDQLLSNRSNSFISSNSVDCLFYSISIAAKSFYCWKKYTRLLSLLYFFLNGKQFLEVRAELGWPLTSLCACVADQTQISERLLPQWLTGIIAVSIFLFLSFVVFLVKKAWCEEPSRSVVSLI